MPGACRLFGVVRPVEAFLADFGSSWFGLGICCCLRIWLVETGVGFNRADAACVHVTFRGLAGDEKVY